MVRAVIFDLGGTLINYRGLSAFEEYFNRLGEEYPFGGEAIAAAYQWYEELRRRAMETLKEASFEDAFRHAGYKLSDDIIAKYLDKIGEMEAKSSRLFPDSLPALEAISAMDVRLGVITNTPHPARVVERDLAHFQIKKYFDSVVVSSALGIRKPHKAIFRKAIDELEIFPSGAMYVGDMPDRDVVGAKGAGLVSVLIDRSGRLRPMTNPHYTISDLSQLPAIVQQLKK